MPLSHQLMFIYMFYIKREDMSIRLLFVHVTLKTVRADFLALLIYLSCPSFSLPECSGGLQWNYHGIWADWYR